MDFNKKEIAKRIKSVMKEKDISASDCAKKLGVSDDTVYKWRNGKSIPKGSNLIKLASALKTTQDYITTGKTPSDNSLASINYKQWLDDKDKIIYMLEKEIQELKNEIQRLKNRFYSGSRDAKND